MSYRNRCAGRREERRRAKDRRGWRHFVRSVNRSAGLWLEISRQFDRMYGQMYAAAMLEPNTIAGYVISGLETGIAAGKRQIDHAGVIHLASHP